MADQLDIITNLSVPRYAPRLEPLPIPEPRWNDEPLLCLQVNDEWVSHLLGVMVALDQSDTWIGTEDQIFDARQQVNEMMLAFMEECMDCCGPNEIPLSRINEDGVFQQSTDDGTTWVDAPEFDPRNTIPRIAPFPPPDTDNAKCIYADSVVNHFKEGFVDVLEEGQTVTEVMATITAIMEWIFGPLTGPIGWIIPAIFAIATAVVIAGITLLKSEMTTAVWDGLRCLLFNNMQSDGSFTLAQTSTIYAGIDDLTTDLIPRTLLKSWIAAIGATGLTNAAHLGMGTTGADCTGCEPGCDNTWSVYVGAGDYFGEILEQTSTYIIAQTTNINTNNVWYIYLITDDVNNCCYINSMEIIEGNPTLNAAACGSAIGSGIANPLGPGCFNQLQPQTADGPFKVKFNIDACP